MAHQFELDLSDFLETLKSAGLVEKEYVHPTNSLATVELEAPKPGNAERLKKIRRFLEKIPEEWLDNSEDHLGLFIEPTPETVELFRHLAEYGCKSAEILYLKFLASGFNRESHYPDF